MSRIVRAFPSSQALADAAVDQILALAAGAIAARGRFVIALTGGSTPENTYQQLAHRKSDWGRWFVFMGDDRHVPLHDVRSNFGMSQRTLLNNVPIPPAQLFPPPTAVQPVEACAEEYDRTVRTFFSGGPVIFDLVLLGLGDDGHTASLFPHAAALKRTAECVTSSPPGILPPPVNRVTFTFPVLNSARDVLFLVAGANKAGTMARVLNPAANVEDTPAAGIHPVRGTLTFLLDAAAAAQLPAEFLK